MLDQCAIHKKNIFSLDPITHAPSGARGLDWRWPIIDLDSVPKGRFGKLHYIRAPVLGVFGTSSQQGKFTLQVFLRQYYQSLGYVVRQIGTEPTAPLFDMEQTFPMGYNADLSITSAEMATLVNDMLHSLDTEDTDLIIVGGQSATVPYDYANLSLYTVPQLAFLMATCPDCVVLCTNPYDDLQYVARTISVIEGLVDSSVSAIAMFPLGFKSAWASSLGARQMLSDEVLVRRCRSMSDFTGKHCVPMTSKRQLARIADYTHDFFVNVE